MSQTIELMEMKRIRKISLSCMYAALDSVLAYLKGRGNIKFVRIV